MARATVCKRRGPQSSQSEYEGIEEEERTGANGTVGE